MANLVLTSRVVGEMAVLDAAGEIDFSNAAALKAEMMQLFEAHHTHLLLNLTHVTFIDSTGLGTIVAIRNQMQATAHELRILCPNPIVHRIFEVTGLVHALPLFGTEAEALK
jgi:anti-sigma B factor antagonist